MRRIFNDPYVDWAGILIVTLVAMGTLIFFGFSSYFNTQERLTTKSSSKVASGSIFDEAAFTAILKEFDHRTTERGTVLQSYGGIGDPSL